MRPISIYCIHTNFVYVNYQGWHHIGRQVSQDYETLRFELVLIITLRQLIPLDEVGVVCVYIGSVMS